MSSHVEQYEAAVAPARAAFAADPAVRLIQDPAIGAAHLEAFLIHWCALGVAMTEPVESWITRAGQACERAGAVELGTALQRHAAGEADHHLLMIADLRRLCARRAAAGRVAPDPDELLATRWPESARRYRALHEDVIAGAEPWGQIAIENEIEMLSIGVGPKLIDNAKALLGDDVLEDLSFLTDHVTLDVAHTTFNRRQLDAFLTGRPEAHDALVTAGSATLDAYRAFLADCVALAARAPAGAG